MSLNALNADIHAEADAILDAGLRALLDQYGEWHIMGSYALGLMTWRDLDLHIVRPTNGLKEFFGLGGKIAVLLQPRRMHFRDETKMRTPDLPVGWYWGIYLGDERAGGWKIDLWQSGPEGFESARRFGETISSRLTEDHRAAILAIKSECWHHPQYRRRFSSADIYSAVLDRGVRSLDEFWSDLEATKGIMPAAGTDRG
jgi:hypothetical protein